MENEQLAVKNHQFYQQGYSEGYKEGFNEAFKSYEKFLAMAKVTSKIEIVCKDFAECPFKKEAQNATTNKE